MLLALEGGLSKFSRMVEGASTKGWIFGQDGPTYADFALAGWFLWLKVAGLPGVWERVKELNEGKWGRLLAAADPYMTVY